MRTWVDRPENSAHTFYNLFGLIAALQDPLPLIDSIGFAEKLVGDGAQIGVWGETTVRPRTILVKGRDTSVIGICGAQNLSQFTGLLNGYWYAPLGDTKGNTNPFAAAACDELEVIVNGFLGGMNHRVLIGGYSMGAVVASNWYCRNYVRPLKPFPTLVTYGGPKCGGNRLQDMERGRPNSWIRIFTNNDPVPYVVPTSAESPGLHRTLSPGASRAANMYAHGSPGYQLDYLGRMFGDVANPTGVSGDTGLAILKWVAGTEGWNTSAHHWTTYKQRLYLARVRYLDSVDEAIPAVAAAIEGPSAPMASQLMAYTPVAPPRALAGSPPIPMMPVPLVDHGGSNPGRGITVRWNGCEIAQCKSRSAARKLRATIKRLRTAMKQATSFDASQLGTAASLQVEMQATGFVGTIS
jgi:hypothetical protein